MKDKKSMPGMWIAIWGCLLICALLVGSLMLRDQQQRRKTQTVPTPVAVVHGEPVEPPAMPNLSRLAARPGLEDCPAGVEVSYRIVDGRPVVTMPLDELESQIRARALCHTGNQLKLLDYIEALKSAARR